MAEYSTRVEKRLTTDHDAFAESICASIRRDLQARQHDMLTGFDEIRTSLAAGVVHPAPGLSSESARARPAVRNVPAAQSVTVAPAAPRNAVVPAQTTPRVAAAATAMASLCGSPPPMVELPAAKSGGKVRKGGGRGGARTRGRGDRRGGDTNRGRGAKPTRRTRAVSEKSVEVNPNHLPRDLRPTKRDGAPVNYDAGGKGDEILAKTAAEEARITREKEMRREEKREKKKREEEAAEAARAPQWPNAVVGVSASASAQAEEEEEEDDEEDEDDDESAEKQTVMEKRPNRRQAPQACIDAANEKRRTLAGKKLPAGKQPMTAGKRLRGK